MARHRHATAAAVEAAWDGVVPLGEADRFLADQAQLWVRAECLEYLSRLRTEISPRELKGEWRRWNRDECKTCGHTGLTGLAVSRTLAWCTCCWGAERQAREPEYVAAEIARVNVDDRARVVAALRAVRDDFAGDAVEGDPAIRVMSEGGALVVDASLANPVSYFAVPLEGSPRWREVSDIIGLPVRLRTKPDPKPVERPAPAVDSERPPSDGTRLQCPRCGGEAVIFGDGRAPIRCACAVATKVA